MPKSADYIELEKLKKSLKKPFWKEVLYYFLVITVVTLIYEYFIWDELDFTIGDVIGNLIFSSISYFISREIRKKKYNDKLREMKDKGINVPSDSP